MEEIVTTLPVLGLYFMETMVIAAIAVALATRLPLLANFITCFVVYVIGNLTSPLVASAQGNNELVGFVGKLIAVIVPNLNVFNVQSAVDAGNPIPADLLGRCFQLSCMFRDRDLGCSRCYFSKIETWPNPPLLGFLGGRCRELPRGSGDRVAGSRAWKLMRSRSCWAVVSASDRLYEATG